MNITSTGHTSVMFWNWNVSNSMYIWNHVQRDQDCLRQSYHFILDKQNFHLWQNWGHFFSGGLWDNGAQCLWLGQKGVIHNILNYDLVNTMGPRQNGRHFTDNIFKCIFLNENVWIFINISLKFVPLCQIHNIPALVQIMAWRQPGNKQLSEPMMVWFAEAYMHHWAS